MKKSLLGFIVAIVAFAIGVVAFESLDFESVVVPDVVVNESESIKGQLIVIELNNSEEDFLDDNQSEENIFDGWYSLDNHQYKGMNEVNMIALSRDYYDKNDKVSSYGSVFTKLENYGDQGVFGSVFAQIDNNKVMFRTEKIEGIEYRFKGEFFKNKIMGVEGEKLLRGTLQKFVKGKKVAEVSGDFAYSEPHCWH